MPLLIVIGPVLDALLPLGMLYEAETVFELTTRPLDAEITEPVTPAVVIRDVPVAAPIFGVTKVGLVERTLLPEPVEDVTPVPPLATASVPAKVTAPVVAVLGVSPVVPALNVVTPPAAPLEAAVIRPLESTVRFVFVYTPAVTAVFESVVALPIEVTSPVRLALVMTVAANDPVPEPVTPPVSVIV